MKDKRTVDMLIESGVGQRMLREGTVHHGIELRFGGRGHRIPLSELTDGRGIMLYAQHEVIKDLIRARVADDGQLLFEVRNVLPMEFDSTKPVVRFEYGDSIHELRCDFIVGCDGYHGVCRHSTPAVARREYVRAYPFGWFGILVKAPPYSPELIYAHHERGFSLVSTRSSEVQRLYFQCD